jgi:hypothetical protein
MVLSLKIDNTQRQGICWMLLSEAQGRCELYLNAERTKPSKPAPSDILSSSHQRKHDDEGHVANAL